MCLIIAYGTEFVLQFLLYTSEKSHAACYAENKDKSKRKSWRHSMAEYLDIVDENGIPTGETVERETAHAKLLEKLANCRLSVITACRNMTRA